MNWAIISSCYFYSSLLPTVGLASTQWNYNVRIKPSQVVQDFYYVVVIWLFAGDMHQERSTVHTVTTLHGNSVMAILSLLRTPARAKVSWKHNQSHQQLPGEGIELWHCDHEFKPLPTRPPWPPIFIIFVAPYELPVNIINIQTSATLSM